VTYVIPPGEEIPEGMTIEQAQEQAVRAARQFNKLIPILTSFARSMTHKNNVRVIADGSVPHTDGNNIYMRPLFGLGKVYKHERKLCDRRDEFSLQMCNACRQHELVMAALYHEIGHIAHGSFDLTTATAVEHAVRRAIEENHGKFAEHVTERINSAPPSVKNDYQALANLISPWLGILVNALEDVRINHASAQIRPGIRKMLEALNMFGLSEIKTDAEGNEYGWKTQPLNVQAIMVVFVLAAGLRNTEEFFAEEVRHLYDDPTLQEIVRGTKTLRSAHSTYYLSFQVLDRLRELGFCLRPDEPMPPPPGDEGKGEDGDEQSESEMDPTGMGGEPSDDNKSEEGGDGAEPADNSVSEPGTGGTSSGEGDDTDDLEQNQDSSSSTNSDGSAGSDDSSSQASQGSSSQEVDGDVAEREPGDPEGSDDGGENESSSSSGQDHQADSSEPTDDSPDDTQETSRPEGRDGSDEVLDTGADHGEGGLPADYDDRYGTPEQAQQQLNKTLGHPDAVDPAGKLQGSGTIKSALDEIMDTAVIKGLYFETAPVNVEAIRIHKPNDHQMFPDGTDAAEAFTGRLWRVWSDPVYYGVECDMEIPESVLGPALMKMRKILTDNKRSRHIKNLKSGKVNANALGKRGFNRDDERLFKRKQKPGKKDYAVLIAIDVSGSTQGLNLALAKRAAKAQAELCHRTGVKFAVWAHSAKRNSSNGYDGGLRNRSFTLDMYCIKDWNDPWDTEHQEVLATLASDSDNLDGHSIEFYRKLLDKVDATDKILMYYTDGKMPAANAAEELQVMQREFKTFKKLGYILPGVGIRTDSPTKHGLDTVRVDDDGDLIKVVTHLEKLIQRG
jgi:hypothetical protein